MSPYEMLCEALKAKGIDVSTGQFADIKYAIRALRKESYEAGQQNILDRVKKGDIL